MRTKYLDNALLVVIAAVLLTGCGGFGKVNQGQVVAYDKTRGLVTLVADSNYTQPGQPRFDVLPPAVIWVPENPAEMGPAPDAGGLLAIDLPARRFTVFDPAAAALRTIEYTLLQQEDRIAPDNRRVAGIVFPIVDREKRTIMVYSPRQRVLLLVSVPPDCFALPDRTWKVGDEVRYYYKDPSRALRMMNVSRTDLTKKDK